MTKFLAILSLAIVVLLLAACGEESGPTAAPLLTAAPIPTAAPASVETTLPGVAGDSSAIDFAALADAPASVSEGEIIELVEAALETRTPEGVSAEEIQSALGSAMSEVAQSNLSVDDVQAVVTQAMEQAMAAEEESAMEMAATAATSAATPTAAPAPSPTATAAPGSNLIIAGAPDTPAPTATSVPRVTGTPAPTPTPAPRPAATPLPTPVPLAVGGTPSSTTFQEYLRERFVSTAEDSVSTFSLDTDRTSYYLALNWARAGYEVDPDSVRAEEWINAFDYRYEPPLRNDSFAISTDVFQHPLDSQVHMARIALQAPEMDYDATPVNVTLVLDASGSMSSGNRVDIARAAAEAIRGSLRSHDRIAVVQFSTDVLSQYTVDHRRPDDSDVARSIRDLTPRNSTNVQAGLNKGVQLADDARRQNPDAYNYIVLMSDGVANVDATDPFAILESAGGYDSSNPLRLITIGVGIENYNDYLLEQLAQHGNGWYRYLTDTGQARATFSRENWLALSIPFADQTRAQVTWDPDMVENWRIVGYENRIASDESFSQARREFAEIPAGAATTVFYELELKSQGLARAAKLGDVALRWVTPSNGESNRQHSPIFSLGDIEFGAVNDSLLQLGALVALSSDRYSSLPYADASGPAVHEDLLHLKELLLSLDSQLGDLGAYQDLAFLMEHITRNSEEALQPSGYSR